MAFSAYAQEEVKLYALDFYGQTYTVNPVTPEGTALDIEDVKSFIPKSFPDYKDKEIETMELIHMIYGLIAGYEHIYNEGVDVLANRLMMEKEVSFAEKDRLIKELYVVFSTGRWKQYSMQFVEEGRPAFGFHFAVVQEQYIRYLSVLYVYNMLVTSPEGLAAIEAYEKAEGIKNVEKSEDFDFE